MEKVIKVQDISLAYGSFSALNKVSFEVNKGDFFGILGPNGAGKTSLFQVISGLLTPTEGEVYIGQENVKNFSVNMKKRIGYFSSNIGIYERLTGLELLLFIGNMYGVHSNELMERINNLIEIFELQDFQHVLIDKYSTGMKKKIGLAATLVHNPDILILDEPFESVDAIVSYNIKSILRDFVKNGGTVLIASHILEIIEHLCTRLMIMNKGKIVHQSSIDDLKGNTLEDYFIEIIKQGEVHAC